MQMFSIMWFLSNRNKCQYKWRCTRRFLWEYWKRIEKRMFNNRYVWSNLIYKTCRDDMLFFICMQELLFYEVDNILVDVRMADTGDCMSSTIRSILSSYIMQLLKWVLDHNGKAVSCSLSLTTTDLQPSKITTPQIIWSNTEVRCH